MFDPLSLLAGAGLLGAGMLAGRKMRPRPPVDPGPVCTCTHGYGQHEQGWAGPLITSATTEAHT